MKQFSRHACKLSAASELAAADPWVARLGYGEIEGLSGPELEAAYQRARQMLGANLLEPARAVLEALIVLQPRATRVARSLGILYLRQQEVPLARSMLHYALGLDAHDPILRLLHGECVLLCGERDAGMALIESALQAAASRPEVHAYVLRAQKCLLMARQATP